MYHYPNQQLYHHSAYQQCPLFVDHNKQHLPSNVENNQLHVNYSNNIVATESDTTRKQVEHSNNAPKTGKVKKKTTNKASVDTSNFSIEERLVAAVWVHERKRTKTSMSQIKYDFRQRFGRLPPAKNTLLVWERKLFATGSVCDAPRTGRPINRRTRMAEVAASVRAAPALSLRARALALRVPRTTLRTILQRDLLARGRQDSTANQARSKAARPPPQTLPPAAPYGHYLPPTTHITELT